MARRRSRAFGRYAVLLAVLGLGALVAVLPPPRTRRGMSAHTLAEAQMCNLESAILLYRDAMGRRPASLESLTEVDPTVGEPWMERIPPDPWGQPYRYATEGLHGYRLTSLGEDGQEGTPDDLTWPKPRPAAR